MSQIFFLLNYIIVAYVSQQHISAQLFDFHHLQFDLVLYLKQIMWHHESFVIDKVVESLESLNHEYILYYLQKIQ